MLVSMIKAGDILRNAREAKEITQVSLAEKVDVSERTIIALENNERSPSFEVLHRLVHSLDISADLIFYPDRAPLTPEQDQIVRELLSCGEKEQKIVLTTLRSLIRALRQDELENQR